MKKLITYITFLLFALTSSAEGMGKYLGGDVSLLPLYEQYNYPYLDEGGRRIDDLLLWLRDECGWNTFRIRLFVNPARKDHDNAADPSVCQDLDYVKRIGKRIKDAGCRFMLDFHYSDTWADPSCQLIPSAWTADTSNDALADKVGSYTADCLKELKAYGAEPDFVQIGNEISYGMLLRNDDDKVYPVMQKSQCAMQWARLSLLLNAAAKAVRSNSAAKIIIHTERTDSPDQTRNFYSYISDVDYDIIGLSYYPFWHGTLAQLSTTLTTLQTAFPDKPVQIVETAYNFQFTPQNPTYDTSATWPYTPDGQYSYINALISALSTHANVEGLSYWCPEEAGNGDKQGNAVMSGWLNRGFWWQGTGNITGSTSKGHWPVTSAGAFAAKAMKAFLNPETAIAPVPFSRSWSESDAPFGPSPALVPSPFGPSSALVPSPFAPVPALVPEASASGSPASLASPASAFLTPRGIVILKGSKRYTVTGTEF